MEHWLNDSGRGEPTLSEKNLSQRHFTTNPTSTNPRMNPGLGGGRSADLNLDTALKLNFMSLLLINSIPTSQKTLFHCKEQSVKADCGNTVVIVL